MEIKRDNYLQQLISRMHNGRVKIITGIRRVGKSYFLFNLFYAHLLQNSISRNHIIEIALDDSINARYRNPLELDRYVRSRIEDEEQYYVLIDEIQNVKEIDNPYLEGDRIGFVDVLLGLIKIDNLDVYVTGSNSKMLSKDVVTEFRDRGDEIHLEPLTYKEFSEVYDGDRMERFREYATYGGLPRTFLLKTHKEKADYLQNLFAETYIRDIIERNRIRNDEKVISDLLDVIASNIGGQTNPSKLEKTFKSEQHVNITHNTIDAYLKYFEDAFFIRVANRFDLKGKKYLSADKKYYFTDIGLRNARVNFRQSEQTHIMENIIYNELVSRGYSVDVGTLDIVERNKEGNPVRKTLEVDFVARDGNKVYYIQSAFSLEAEGKKEQESRSLKQIKDSFTKIIVTADNIAPYYDEDGIYNVNLEDFLLDKNSLEKA
ncbi:MAG: ATP-binding protein [Erysipelotrichaceae bacterium]|nr:ATP-binding protein [Erysipelotrichaceae bacterium]